MLSQSTIDRLFHLRLPDVEIREYLLALTPEMIDVSTLRMFVETLYSLSEAPELNLEAVPGDTIDSSGTGGSGLPHFNTSTAAAFVLAAGGLTVTKFGNRAMTSQSGSFDFLYALGFPLCLPVEEIPGLLQATGLVFLYAPQFYPVLAKFTSVRRSLDVKTIFNFIGPLINPARPAYRVLGCPDSDMQLVLARYLAETTGIKKALVVRGLDGLDEISHSGESQVIEVAGGELRDQTYTAQPGSNGQQQPEDRDGDSAIEPESEFLGVPTVEDNVRLFERLIEGRDLSSAYHHMVCLNAGAGFYAAGKAAGIDEGRLLADKLLASGAVKQKFEELKEAYARFTP